MLLSMTGFGEAHRSIEGLSVVVEVRTINSRYFKLSLRCPEGFNALESEIESVVREQVRRGTIQVALRIDRAHRPDDYRLDAEVLNGYRLQLEAIQKRWHLPDPLPLAQMLALPGVVHESITTATDASQVWPVIRETLNAALANLAKMRTDEGRAMTADLEANRAVIFTELKKIEARAPVVQDAYRTRLTERVNRSLAEFQITLAPEDLIKELAVYADRSDISEETVRLASHLEQFQTIMQSEEGAGRKLEFLTQEMFRETNTIGSKCNDVEIARQVIEIKTAIERIREQIQNVE